MISKLRLIGAAPTLVRPVGTSVPYVRYQPLHNHLFFARQHDRARGDLEKTPVPWSWLQIGTGVLLGVAGLSAAALVLL